MKKNIWTLTIFIWCVIIAGCSQISDFENLDKHQSKDNDRIEDLISGFYHRIHSDTRSGRNFQISDVSTRTYHISDTLKSRSVSKKITSAYDIHTVTLDFGEEKGYAILSDTPGLDCVFYFTENGCVEDTALIVPLKELVDNVPLFAAEVLSGNIIREEPTRADDTVSPLVKYEWSQYIPFNNYAAYCDCESCKKIGNHMPIGCVTVAVGHVITVMRKFRGTFYGNKNIDFDNAFPISYKDGRSPQKDLAVAHFLQEIALNCETKFGCNGSAATLYAATNYMRDLGYKVDHKKGELNKDRCIRNLHAGLPHIAAGYDDKGGHAWVLDGVTKYQGSDSFHINWGWGKSNGWSNLYYHKTGEDGILISYYKNHQHMYFGGYD